MIKPLFSNFYYYKDSIIDILHNKMTQMHGVYLLNEK